MLRSLLLFFFSMLFIISLSAQIPDRAIDTNQYPANNTPDSKREAIFSTYFEETNVGNLHVFAPEEKAVAPDHYFKGRELPRGLFGIFEPKWRESMPEDFKAYAVYSLRGEGKPYYLLRFSGAETDRMIGLFEMVGDQLHHKLTLASYWCVGDYCLQKDSWLQDFDGDVRLDVLTKVRMTDNRRNEQVVDEYYAISKQLKDGSFSRKHDLQVQVNDYFMHDPAKEEE